MSSNRAIAWLATVGVLLAPLTGAQATPRVSGPYAHHNLTVYLLHGEPGEEGAVLTLDAALEGGQVVVHETGSVNQLAVENVSRDQTVFLQAGDIVKGGQQDRVLSQDLVLAPGSGRVPIAAFCVEQGRWSPRGGEAADSFASSKHKLSSKELKLAVRRAKNQQDVWNEVEALQGKLSAATGAEVASPDSATSLQLSLENEQLAETRKAYVDALTPLPARHPDASGFVVSVNGALSSAEHYGSAALFRTMWPKLLDAAATEAVAGLPEAPAAPPAPATSDVRAFLAGAEGGSELPGHRADPARSEARESDAAVFFESRRSEAKGSWIHRSYIAK